MAENDIYGDSDGIDIIYSKEGKPIYNSNESEILTIQDIYSIQIIKKDANNAKMKYRMEYVLNLIDMREKKEYLQKIDDVILYRRSRDFHSFDHRRHPFPSNVFFTNKRIVSISPPISSFFNVLPKGYELSGFVLEDYQRRMIARNASFFSVNRWNDFSNCIISDNGLALLYDKEFQDKDFLALEFCFRYSFQIPAFMLLFDLIKKKGINIQFTEKGRDKWSDFIKNFNISTKNENMINGKYYWKQQKKRIFSVALTKRILMNVKQELINPINGIITETEDYIIINAKLSEYKYIFNGCNNGNLIIKIKKVALEKKLIKNGNIEYHLKFGRNFKIIIYIPNDENAFIKKYTRWQKRMFPWPTILKDNYYINTYK